MPFSGAVPPIRAWVELSMETTFTEPPMTLLDLLTSNGCIVTTPAALSKNFICPAAETWSIVVTAVREDSEVIVMPVETRNVVGMRSSAVLDADESSADRFSVGSSGSGIFDGGGGEGGVSENERHCHWHPAEACS